MVYIKFLIHWCIVCLYYGKKLFSYSAPTKSAIMDYAFLTIFPGEIKLGSLLHFDHVWVGEDLYQIWCFIQNLHYGFVYTPHYFLILELNTEIYSVNLRIQTDYSKIPDITHYLDTFHAVVYLMQLLRLLLHYILV